MHAGEIVGLAGLVGAGRSELAQLIFGVRKATAGVIEIDGEPVVIHSPREAIDLGIGFLTENRKEQGLFLELAAQENITMATLERDATWGMLNRRRRKPSPMTPSSCLTSACRTPRCAPADCPEATSRSC
ncbi:ribose ABC transporter ATP-binding protein RbsA [Klebsiella pneumoniae]|nr:ribose ABC transporter ATP-binding protein RbsA [Klebsiella pneumoniae]